MLRRQSAKWMIAVCLIVASAALERAAAAEVVISINKAAQRMLVLIDGVPTYNWVISTGVGGGPYDGAYRPGFMARHWASRKYGMAPMPYSIFFDGNYAIHGTVKVGQLGRRASKGCVRLHPRDAAVLFALVGKEKANTTIVVNKAAHFAAVPVKSDAPPLEATGGLVKIDTPAEPQLVTSSNIIRDEPVAAPVRKRKTRKAKRFLLPFGLRFGRAF
jgi:L,D-transpeptidase-like protein